MSLPKFRRSTADRKLAGVFGGLGDAFGIDATYLRLAFIVIALVTGIFPAVVGYAIAWAITQEGTAPGGSRENADPLRTDPLP